MKPKQRVAELEALIAEKDREIARLRMDLAIEKAARLSPTNPYMPTIPYVPTIPSDRTWYPRPYEIWCGSGTRPASTSFKVTL